jgi:hypothetical protein
MYNYVELYIIIDIYIYIYIHTHILCMYAYMFVCTYERYAEKQNQIQIDPPYIPSIISPRFTAVTFSGVTSYRPTRSLTWTWFQQPKRWGGGHHQIRGLSSGK